MPRAGAVRPGVICNVNAPKVNNGDSITVALLSGYPSLRTLLEDFHLSFACNGQDCKTSDERGGRETVTCLDVNSGVVPCCQLKML